MGTLTKILGEDEEAIKNSFKPATQATLDNGGGGLFGIPFPLELPRQDLLEAQAGGIDQAEELGVFSDAYAKTIMAIDEGLPPAIPFAPIADWTFVLPGIPQFLIEIGIENPLEWLEANWYELDIVANSPCDAEKFAEHLKEIDPTIDKARAQENVPVLCIALPSISIPKFPPEFSFDFSLGLLPIELFALPNFTFPQINWAITFTFEGLIDIIIKLIELGFELVSKIIEGIIAFITFVIEFIFKLIIEIILAVLAPLLEGILFVAQLITYITKVVAAFIVALVGHLIGDGVVTLIVAQKLGLSQ